MLRSIKNLLKRSYRDLSIRSDYLGAGHLAMADLAARFMHVNKMRGSFLEFGVYQGGTFSNYYNAFQRHGLDLKMYAFDGFQGLPEKGPVDAVSGYHEFPEGAFSCSQEDFVKFASSKGVPRSAYTIVPGLFNESLTPDLYEKLEIPPAALINIDVDLHDSTRDALNFVLPLLQDGTMIVFDEYFAWRANPELGERRAFEEFLGRNPSLSVTEYAKFGSMGIAFIVHTERFPQETLP